VLRRSIGKTSPSFLSVSLKRHFSRALEVSPVHANSLYNYGVLLDSHCLRKPEAEELYCRCLEVEPRHSFALYNLAVLREEVMSTSLASNLNTDESKATEEVSPKYSAPEIRSLYEKAVAADPKDATTMADCGRFVKEEIFSPLIFYFEGLLATR
jgi:tetratricopeptide (TPR) repeat protein